MKILHPSLFRFCVVILSSFIFRGFAFHLVMSEVAYALSAFVYALAVVGLVLSIGDENGN
jgi:hypothetical protein